jgi:hypothetical protein
LPIRVRAVGRSFHESTVLMSSGSSLVLRLVTGFHRIAGSRNQECSRSSGSTDRPVSSREAFICAQTSALISLRVHSLAGLP